MAIVDDEADLGVVVAAELDNTTGVMLSAIDVAVSVVVTGGLRLVVPLLPGGLPPVG